MEVLRPLSGSLLNSNQNETQLNCQGELKLDQETDFEDIEPLHYAFSSDGMCKHIHL